MAQFEYDEERLAACEEAIGYAFHDPSLLLMALTHSSFTADKLCDNERLEFLGDSVLGVIIGEALYRIFPLEREGVLTERKSAAVRGESLAQATRRLGLPRCFRVGRGVGAVAEIPDSVCANIFEALVAAVFLDGGFEAARLFVLTALDLSSEPEAGAANFKSLLQEYLQQRGRAQPVYDVVDMSGPDHRKEFTVRVLIDGEPLGTGQGASKKQAEQQAAREALDRVRD